MSGLLVKLFNDNATITTPHNANNYVEDPMLNVPGGIALFDYANEKCWPQRSGTANQKVFNLIQNEAVPHLLLGDTDAVESIDPVFNKGFDLDASQAQRFTTPKASGLAFTNQSWFMTAWVTFPTAAASIAGPAAIFVKGGGYRSYSLYVNGFSSLVGEVAISSDGGTLCTASAAVPFVVGVPYQLGLACEIRPNGLTVGIFVNGQRVGSMGNPAVAIADLLYPLTIGSFATGVLPGSFKFLRLYAENLSASGFSADERIAYEWRTLKNFI